MIDLEAVKCSAGSVLPCTDGRLGVVVSPQFLAQVVNEIEQGRDALAELSRERSRQGLAFGLGAGERL